MQDCQGSSISQGFTRFSLLNTTPHQEPPEASPAHIQEFSGEVRVAASRERERGSGRGDARTYCEGVVEGRNGAVVGGSGERENEILCESPF